MQRFTRSLLVAALAVVLTATGAVAAPVASVHAKMFTRAVDTIPVWNTVRRADTVSAEDTAVTATTYTGCVGFRADTDAWADPMNTQNPSYWSSGRVTVHDPSTCGGVFVRWLYQRDYTGGPNNPNCGYFRVRVGKIQPYVTPWVPLCSEGDTPRLVVRGNFSGRAIALETAYRVIYRTTGEVWYSVGAIYYVGQMIV
jgi:hypothetical protein